MVYGVLGCTYGQQIHGHVAADAGNAIQCFLGFSHIGLVEQPRRLAFRQVPDNLQARVIAALSPDKRHHSLINQAQDYLLQVGPVEFLVLLIGEEAISAFMQGYKNQGASDLFCGVYP